MTFARVSGESSLLSALKLTGVPMEFNPSVFEYNLNTYGLNQTILTAMAENPESTVTVTKNGVPVSISSPIPMSYGTTVFVIKVISGKTNTTYTVKVENNKLDEGTDPGEDDPVSPNKPDPVIADKPDSSKSVSYSAGLTIGGIKQRDLTIGMRGGRAVGCGKYLLYRLSRGGKEAWHIRGSWQQQVCSGESRHSSGNGHSYV